MDKKAEAKWRWRQFKLRSSIFLRKNGLYVALGLCLAVIGTAAALIFIGGDEDDNRSVDHSYDQRLDDVTIPTATAFPTAKPTSFATKPPIPTIKPTIIPDITPAPSETPTITPEPVVLIAPVDGHITRVFAMDSLIYSKTLNQWMTHSGVDVSASLGSEVRCVLDGTVENVYSDDMLGVTVIITHSNGMKTVYSGLKEEPSVEIGQRVQSRAVIGYIGDTAISECAEESHLHFELHINDMPVDPAEYIMFHSVNE